MPSLAEKMMKTLSWCISLFIAATSSAFASESYDLYVGLYPDGRLADHLPKPMNGTLAQGHFSLENIAVEKSTFDDVLSKFGDTEIFRLGKPGNVSAEKGACYSASDDIDDTVLLVESGPMGGWQRLTTISITRAALWNHPHLCSRSPLVSKRLTTASGLRLGLPIADLFRLIGKPTIKTDRFFGYYYQMQEGDWFRVFVIEGALADNVVNSITVHQMVVDSSY
jgi:hypothetical protein